MAHLSECLEHRSSSTNEFPFPSPIPVTEKGTAWGKACPPRKGMEFLENHDKIENFRSVMGGEMEVKPGNALWHQVVEELSALPLDFHL